MPRTFEHHINALYYILSMEEHQNYLSYNVYDIYKQTLLDAYNNTNHMNFKIHHELAEVFNARVKGSPKNCITKGNLFLLLPLDVQIDEEEELEQFENDMGHLTLSTGYTYYGQLSGIVVDFTPTRRKGRKYTDESMQEIIERIRNHVENYRRVA